MLELPRCNFLYKILDLPDCIFWPLGNSGGSVVTTHATTCKPKVSPYSVIDIAPIQQQLLPEQSAPPSPPPANESEGDIQDVPSSPGLTSGYSVPVPCGYATPSNVPVITPAYTTPVIIRHFSVDEDGNRARLLKAFLFFIFFHWSDELTITMHILSVSLLLPFSPLVSHPFSLSEVLP